MTGTIDIYSDGTVALHTAHLVACIMTSLIACYMADIVVFSCVTSVTIARYWRSVWSLWYHGLYMDFDNKVVRNPKSL
jgi:hypothetical protein